MFVTGQKIYVALKGIILVAWFSKGRPNFEENKKVYKTLEMSEEEYDILIDKHMKNG